MKHKNQIILSLIIILGSIIRIWYWINFNRYIIMWDESPHSFGGLIISRFITGGFDFGYASNIVSHHLASLYCLFFYPYGNDLMTAVSFLILGPNILAARLPTMIFSILIIWSSYFLGREIFNKKIGLISAFIAAINPYFIVYGGTAYVDIQMTFFMIMAVYFCLRAVKTSKNKYYWLSGLFIGLAGFIKVPGFVAIVPVLVIILYYKKLVGLLSKKTLVILLVPFIFFTIYFSGPFLIKYSSIDLKTQEIVSEKIFHWFEKTAKYAEPDEPTWQTLNGWLYYPLNTITEVGGIMAFILIIMGLIVLIKNKTNDQKFVVLSYIIFIYLIIVFIDNKHPRYAIPYLPFLCVLSALALEKIWSLFKNKKTAVIIFIIIGLTIFAEILIINKEVVAEKNRFLYDNLSGAINSIMIDNINQKPALIVNDKNETNALATPNISLLVFMKDPKLIYSVYWQNKAGEADYLITDILKNKNETVDLDLIYESKLGEKIYVYKRNKNF